MSLEMNFPGPLSPYRAHEGHWADDEMTEAMDFVMGEEFLYGKTDLQKITSAGIHIGAATTHITISKLGLRRGGQSITSKSIVKTKEIHYESPITPTPFLEDGSLDTASLKALLEESYDRARLIADLIDTGVVSMSGSAAGLKNRLAVQRLFGPLKSRYVFLSQGPNLQAMLAALGSGAVAKSGSESKRVLNVDLGGSGAQLALVVNGGIEAVFPFLGGSRVLEYDERGNLKHLGELGQRIASELGLSLQLGKPVTRSEREVIGRFLANGLIDYLEGEELPEAVKKLAPAALPALPSIDFVQFSGGVAEYVYGYGTNPQGDIGYEWGAAIRKRAPRLSVTMSVHTPSIRTQATPVGLAYHQVELPSESVYCSHGHLHGLKNALVVSPRFKPGFTKPEEVRAEVEAALSRFDLADDSHPFALSMDFVAGDDDSEILAKGLFSALRDRVDHDHPLILIGETGVPRHVGRKIGSLGSLGGDIVSLCGLHSHDLDFLEVGEVEHDQDVPIVTRSLVFR